MSMGLLNSCDLLENVVNENSATELDDNVIDEDAGIVNPEFNKYVSEVFIPEEEDDLFVWSLWTYQQIIDNIYEPLRKQYPNYISRSVIGRDATDTYDIWQYTFDPGYSEQTLYVQAGVHPYEYDAYIGLGRAMQIICNDWEKYYCLSRLRWFCKIVVVPVVNVWGVSQPWEHRTFANANLVNLNRDTFKQEEAETVAVTSFILSLNQERRISGAIDFHTTTDNSYGDYMLRLHDDAINYRMSMNVGMMLVQKNILDRTPEYLAKWDLDPYETRLPYWGGYTDGTYESFLYANGIPAITCEHSDFVWSNSRSTGPAITKSIECVMNHLLGFARAGYFADK